MKEVIVDGSNDELVKGVNNDVRSNFRQIDPVDDVAWRS